MGVGHVGGHLRARVLDRHVHDPVLFRILDAERLAQAARGEVEDLLLGESLALVGGEQLEVELVVLDGPPHELVALQDLALLPVVLGGRAAAAAAADDHLLTLAEEIGELGVDHHRRRRLVDLGLLTRVQDRPGDGQRDDGRDDPLVLAYRGQVPAEVEADDLLVLVLETLLLRDFQTGLRMRDESRGNRVSRRNCCRGSRAHGAARAAGFPSLDPGRDQAVARNATGAGRGRVRPRDNRRPPG